MTISNKIIEEVITETAGADVLPLVKLLKNKKNVSEFKLAEALKIEINQARNMLYRLYNANLVSFVRKKDKKKGWYIYYWTFDLKRVKYLAKIIKRKRLEELKEKLAQEKSSQFFVCPNKCVRLDFDHAMSFEFKCPECGAIVQQEDNTEKIKKLEAEIKKLEEEIKQEEKKEKIKLRRIKKRKPKKAKKVKKKKVKKKGVKIKKKRKKR
ncbi:transcription factor E [Candidatus Woesearchaeota archaeon]|nr:transcription factor E [Candidatus Woesearchaeota archaeon]